MVDERVKCKYCSKEVWKVNVQDHEEECSKNPENKFIKLFSHKITKKQYWLGVLVLFGVALIIKIGSLPPEPTSSDYQSMGKLISFFLLFFGGLYLGLTTKWGEHK